MDAKNVHVELIHFFSYNGIVVPESDFLIDEENIGCFLRKLYCIKMKYTQKNARLSTLYLNRLDKCNVPRGCLQNSHS